MPHFFFLALPAPLQGRSQLWMLLLVFQTLSPHLQPSVSTHISLKPRLRWVEPQHATALFPCVDSLGLEPKTVLPPCGFHTWEERNNLYMGEHGGELGKGSGGSVRIFRASILFSFFPLHSVCAMQGGRRMTSQAAVVSGRT